VIQQPQCAKPFSIFFFISGLAPAFAGEAAADIPHDGFWRTQMSRSILKVAAPDLALAISVIAASLAPSSSFASEQPTAFITAISVDNNGGPYVFLASGARTAKPSCATDDFWAISNPTGDNAKAMLANIMTAKALGRQVHVAGTGSCDTAHTTRERVSFITVQ
jgi:hypothetical protein